MFLYDSKSDQNTKNRFSFHFILLYLLYIETKYKATQTKFCQDKK